jgi:hypothetical protein
MVKIPEGANADIDCPADVARRQGLPHQPAMGNLVGAHEMMQLVGHLDGRHADREEDHSRDGVDQVHPWDCCIEPLGNSCPSWPRR